MTGFAASAGGALEIMGPTMPDRVVWWPGQLGHLLAPDGMRPEFERAVRNGDLGGIDAQLASGVDINSLDRYGQTALMLAAHSGRLDVVEVLLRHGARLDVAAKYGLTALMLAILAGHERIALSLVRTGADLTILGAGAPGFSGKCAYDLAMQHEMKELCSEIAARQHAAI